jgi:enoyl-CoA hydratase/carnithine racemase
MSDAFASAGKDENVRVVILPRRGRAFCAEAATNEDAEADSKDVAAGMRSPCDSAAHMMEIFECPKPGSRRCTATPAGVAT